jgi:peptidoglycan/LPS O-acetylase OafA/YrhL
MQTNFNTFEVPDKPSSYRSEIDGLRMLAVIAVIINHFNKDLLPSGYLGVDIFFAISGYVITSSLATRGSKNFGDFILGFYTRRIKRLFPALALCVLVSSVAICLFNVDPNASIRTGIAALFGLSNLYLLKKSTDYFGSSAELNTFTHTWSLGVEEQFYFIFPFLVWFSGFGRQHSKGRRNLFFVVGSLFIASVIVFLSLNNTNQSAAYFFMPSRFWEMAAGCLLFIGFHGREQLISGIVKRIQPTFVLCLLFLALFIPLKPTVFSVAATFIAVALAIVLMASLRPNTLAYKFLTLPLVVFLGKISYSLYLWHWPVLAISRWTIGIHWWSVPLQVGLMLLLAIASYSYVEQPLRLSDWSILRWKTIGYGLAGIAGVAAAIFTIGKNSYALFLGRNDNPFQQRRSSILYQDPSKESSIKLAATRGITNLCNMAPHQLKGKEYKPKPIVNDSFIDKCLNQSRSKRVVLVGDSFANIISRHVSLLASERGYDFSSIIGYGCPYPLRKEYILNAASGQCEVDASFLRKAIVSRLGAGDILMLRLYFPKDEYINYYNRDSLPPVNAYDRELLSLIGEVKNKNASMIIIGANPTRESLFPGCVDAHWFNRLQQDSCGPIEIDKSQRTAFALAHDLHLARLLDGIPSVRFVPVTSIFCNLKERNCPIAIGKDLVYGDEQHLTELAIDKIYPELNSAILSLER